MNAQRTPEAPEVGSDRNGFFIRFPNAETAYATKRAVEVARDLYDALLSILRAHEAPNGACSGEAFLCEAYASAARAALAKARGGAP